MIQEIDTKIWKKTSVETANEFKDAVQTNIITNLFLKKNILLTAFTGFGKSYLIKKAIKELLVLKTDVKVLIVVPTNYLQSTLKTELLPLFENQILTQNLILEINVINSVTMYEKGMMECDLLIIDECHNILNFESMYFSQCLNLIKFEHSLLLSATIKKEYQEFLDATMLNKGINTIYNYNLTIYWAFKNDLIPKFTIYNVEIDLTLEEKFEYVATEKVINNCKKYFAQFGIFQPFAPVNLPKVAEDYNVNSGILFGIKNKWIKSIAKRKSIIQNAEEKLIFLKQLIEQIDEKALIFVSSIAKANTLKELPNVLLYHSELNIKDRKNNMTIFKTLDNQKLVSIDSLKEGVNVEDCDIGIRDSYTSNKKDAIQQLGRVLRLNEQNKEKQSLMINFVIKNFVIGESIIHSQERVWLLKSLEGQKYEFITKEALITILKERNDKRI